MLQQFQGSVGLLSTQILLDVFFKVHQAELEFESFSGEMIKPPYKLLCFERGDAVAAVVHDKETDTVLLVEQFRYPTWRKTGGWIFELVAGMLKDSEDPTAAILREILEEAGYEAVMTEHISTFYVSPGGTSERIFLYYVSIQKSDERHEGGGLAEEGENIRRHMVPVSMAFQMLSDGIIQDAKTIIGLQWLRQRI